MCSYEAGIITFLIKNDVILVINPMLFSFIVKAILYAACRVARISPNLSPVYGKM